MRRLLHCLLLLGIAGCADHSTEPTPDRTESVEQDTSLELGTVRTFDEEMAATSARLPGFAGTYIGSDGALVVRMVQPQPLVEVAREVGDLLARLVHIGPELATERAALLSIRHLAFDLHRASEFGMA